MRGLMVKKAKRIVLGGLDTPVMVSAEELKKDIALMLEHLSFGVASGKYRLILEPVRKR